MKAVHPKKILSNCIFICWLIVGAQTPCFMKTESTFVLLCILIDQILVHQPKSKVRRRSQDPLSKPSPNYFKEKPKSKSCCSPVDWIQNVLGPNKCNGGRAVPERPMQMVEEFLKKKNGGASIVLNWDCGGLAIRIEMLEHLVPLRSASRGPTAAI